MIQLVHPLYSWDNGAFIMIGVFAVVIIGLVSAIFLMMGSNKKKKE
jgi:flagellar basal body-associated protein FliL